MENDASSETLKTYTKRAMGQETKRKAEEQKSGGKRRDALNNK